MVVTLVSPKSTPRHYSRQPPSRDRDEAATAVPAPRLVLYNPDLTLDLPPDVSAASGMNAIAHCVKALNAPDASPTSAPSRRRWPRTG